MYKVVESWIVSVSTRCNCERLTPNSTQTSSIENVGLSISFSMYRSNFSNKAMSEFVMVIFHNFYWRQLNEFMQKF